MTPQSAPEFRREQLGLLPDDAHAGHIASPVASIATSASTKRRPEAAAQPTRSGWRQQQPASTVADFPFDPTASREAG